MQPNISTKLLHAFLALNECRHFTRAAQRCHLSQSAFSVVIQKLETTVGTQLVERDTRNVTLTAEGEIFVEVARSLVADIESAFSDMADYVARRKGRVSMAALPSLAANGLPAVIAAYKKQFQGISVQLYDALSDQCLELLRLGKVDLVVTAPGARLMEFETRTLCSDPFYLVCRRDHPLAEKTSIALTDLTGCDLIHLAKSTSVRQKVDLLIRNIAVNDTGFEVEHLATVAGLIEHGLGISLVPALTLFQFRQLNLKAIPVETEGVIRPIYIVKQKDRNLSIAARGMFDLIVASFQNPALPDPYL
ncbi:LysR substrate-binding domain-containing protein [Glaciimonas sp. CA11.2]|uniref:LysR family transcriptional regulator n=1 Tax=Glaciimonas sp. CA11.2 TaxID=3048601 RepID=UPI002AB4D558|nr:LysR substrate-binding domain-containing protein [Glaciimonas sp. CA11.2]MDY7545404.1 LysR substrate-binding domain-containing protein [Glaciimonas sp. CA11.2]MEB0162322.1 LysR substrate-binding domain-containing protein [Glaciimonas sp. CA11.2]